jgi:hypothetical protein
MLSALLFMVLMDKPDLDRNVAIGRNAAGDQAQRWPRRPSSNSISGPSNWVIALIITQAQPPGQRGRPVVAQALGVRHRDQEQVQRGRARLAAIDEVLLYESLINPAELLGDLANSLGPENLLDCLHRTSR